MDAPFKIIDLGWKKPERIKNKSFTCGYCGRYVSSDRGYGLHVHEDASGNQVGGIYICPNCNGPSLITPENKVFPGHTMGNPVAHLPKDIEGLYRRSQKVHKPGLLHCCCHGLPKDSYEYRRGSWS